MTHRLGTAGRSDMVGCSLKMIFLPKLHSFSAAGCFVVRTWIIMKVRKVKKLVEPCDIKIGALGPFRLKTIPQASNGSKASNAQTVFPIMAVCPHWETFTLSMSCSAQPPWCRCTIGTERCGSVDWGLAFGWMTPPSKKRSDAKKHAGSESRGASAEIRDTKDWEPICS